MSEISSKMAASDEGLMLGPADPPTKMSSAESDRRSRSHLRSSASRRSSSKESDYRSRSASKRSASRSKSVENGIDKFDADKKKRVCEKLTDISQGFYIIDKTFRESSKDSRRESRDRDRDREKGMQGSREKDDVDRRRREKGRERHRSRERDSRNRRSHSGSYDDYDRRRRRRSGSRRRDRSRSRSYGRDRRRHDRSRNRSRNRDRSRDRSRYGSRDRNRSRGRTRDRSNSYDREKRESRLDTIKEESQNNRFDLTQTIQELMNNTTSTKNFVNLFASNNSNDSFTNGFSENSQDGTERKRKKKSRWGGTESDKTFIPGMPTILPSSLDPTQQEAYLVQLQIEEISRKLRTGDLGIPQNPQERSPSPEPIYSSDGKRLNTREFRCRKRLEEQRHLLIQKMQSVNPDFKPPADYKPPVTRVSDKVLIPQEQHPDINFVGLLIGPRGNTLKAMEKETGAKIIIRGKGSIKEGKVGKKDGQPLPGEDEPLHAFITAPNPEAVKKAVDKIKDVIRQGIEVPEGHNDLRRMQLRELAQLNGTLRENDCPRCTNCGSTEHKSWLCPDKPNVTNSIVCTVCGSIGHISKDCRVGKTGIEGEIPTEDCQAKIDEEYMSLMAELGEGPPPSKQTIDPLAQVHLNRGYSLFDKKPSQPLAIQAAPATSNAPPSMSSIIPSVPAAAPPPPMPPGWGLPASVVHSSLGLPMIPPPGANPQPPTAVPPMLPWMNAPQPPPPGGDAMNPPIPGTTSLPPPPPPGTGPMPPLVPPPPPGTSAPLPPWSGPPGMMSSYGGSWNSGYAPPPPPPCVPPPPGVSLAQPPPPPPPSK